MDPYEMKSEILAAMAHPNRIRILEFLRNGPKCACEIAPALELEQSNLSRHMKLLVQSGLVTNWKDGQKVMYQVSDDEIYTILDKISRMVRNRAAARMEVLKIEAC